MKIYRLRRDRDGLYSRGGTYPRWTGKGKVWSSLGALKNHLRLTRSCGFSLEGITVECYELTETHTSSDPASAMMDAHDLKVKAAKDRKWARRVRK